MRTGDIKGFVITEESGIAKGIRRIVAVTGHEAQEVTRVADTFEARLWEVQQLTGKAKDSSLKTLTVVRSFHPDTCYSPNYLFPGTWSGGHFPST